MNDARPNLKANLGLPFDELQAVQSICDAIPGWSDFRHYVFFREVISAQVAAGFSPSLFMAGVYQGRDLAFVLEVLRRHQPGRPFRIVAADLFSTEACADWPAHLRGKSWKDAGFGQAPSLELARKNLAPYLDPVGHRVGLELIQGNSVQVMRAWRGERFGFVYLDTSHDEKTVADEIEAAAGLIAFPGFLAGDDYSDAGTWGVQRAVRARFGSRHDVFASWIWYACPTSLESFIPPTK